MLTEEELVEASALHRRGWSISAIARELAGFVWAITTHQPLRSL
jgi:hypothetical protein